MTTQALREFSAIALVRGMDVDVGTWRRRLDKLGYPSIEFENLQNLFLAIASGRRFSVAFIPVSEANGDLDRISFDGVQILVIVNDDAWSHSAIRNKENSTLRKFHYINCNATEPEWEFRAELLFNTTNQEKSKESFELKSVAEANFRHKDFEISVMERRVLYKGFDTFLKSREYELAVLLFLNVGRVLRRSWLMTQVWGEASVDSRALDVCISRLREKLHLERQNISIRSVYRKGYQLLDAGDIDKCHQSLDEIIAGGWIKTPLERNDHRREPIVSMPASPKP